MGRVRCCDQEPAAFHARSVRLIYSTRVRSVHRAMPASDKSKRLAKLRQIPPIAGLDHRFFLDENGKDPRLAELSRHERRKLAAGTRRLSAAYRRILLNLHQSGAGYPIDQLLRQLAFEYTHRYASAGIGSQPVSFNYFEPFCDIKLIENSVAPYALPVSELDHLFSIVDYLDYVTSPEGSPFDSSQLLELPDGKAFHYSLSGDILDFTFLTPEGREFVASGFSMVRRERFLHWYLVGGEIYSPQEWETLIANQGKIALENVDPYKRLFLSESIKENGDSVGAPVPLEGTTTAMRTIIAGEFDLTSNKHLGRCYMMETENSFNVLCDDPDVFERMSDASMRAEMIKIMRDRIEGAAAMWNLAEAMFQLPAYFTFKIHIAKSIAVVGGKRLPPTTARGGRGLSAHFRYVSAIEYTDDNLTAIRSYAVPHYEVETEGYWRRLSPDQQGRDADGNSVRGRTWIKACNKWRERPDGPKIVYVKSSISAARLRLSEYLAAAKNGAPAVDDASIRGVLYVLRCMGMEDEVYKVGWTSGTAEQRAKELSSATGVPSSFVIVEAWRHPDPEGLEKSVHAMLSPYRVSDAREFFRVKYTTIKRIIEAEIARSHAPGSSAI